MASSSYLDAEAVIDEVSVLEAALREALERRQAATACSRDGHEAATYAASSACSAGGQRFDAALASYGVQLRAWIDLQVDARLGQLVPRLENLAAASEGSERAAEARAVAVAQSKLLAVVEEISDEITQLKSKVASCQLGQQQESGVAIRLARLEDEVRRLEKLDGVEQELAHCRRAHAELEARLEGLQATELDCLNGVGGELERMRQQLEARVEVLRSDISQDTRILVEESQAHFGEDLVALQQRLVAELRAETTTALNRESAAIAALDEQLWITDQRLGQRIDEIAHLNLRERVALAERGRLSSGSAQEDSPRRLAALLATELESADEDDGYGSEFCGAAATAVRPTHSAKALASTSFAAKVLSEAARKGADRSDRGAGAAWEDGSPGLGDADSGLGASRKGVSGSRASIRRMLGARGKGHQGSVRAAGAEPLTTGFAPHIRGA